jgi:SHS2 domain-containing protein
MDESTGYREVEHTADWELEVWGPDLSSLFEQAARGMYWLSGVQLDSNTRKERSLDLQAVDIESLLVSFLTELLYISEESGLAFDQFEIKIEGESLTARMVGAPIKRQTKEIKAVTYHNLDIQSHDGEISVNIVFDV